MNQEPRFSDGPRENAGPSEDPERHARLEQRLRKIQPRPPCLDVAVIERAARQEDQPQAAGRPYRWLGTLAGSWASGAVAGALITFLVVGRGAPPDTSADGKTPSTQEARQATTSNQAVVMDRPNERPGNSSKQDRPIGAKSFVPVVLMDPFDSADFAYGHDRPTLRAGDFTRGSAVARPARWRGMDRVVSGNRPDATRADSKKRRTVAPAPKSTPAITRERLLQELLHGDPNLVL